MGEWNLIQPASSGGKTKVGIEYRDEDVFADEDPILFNNEVHTDSSYWSYSSGEFTWLGDDNTWVTLKLNGMIYGCHSTYDGTMELFVYLYTGGAWKELTQQTQNYVSGANNRNPIVINMDINMSKNEKIKCSANKIYCGNIYGLHISITAEV